MYTCSHCGREFNSNQGHNSHSGQCKSNPNKSSRVYTKPRKKGIEPWNKGLTKHTDERLKKQGEKGSKTNKGRPQAPWTEERKKNHSLACKGKCGGYRAGSGRGKKSKYLRKNGKIIHCDSSYERILCKILDSYSNDWIKIEHFL